MNRTAANYFRNERMRLAERLTDIQRETAANRARLVELEREEQLLSELLRALDAHVPIELPTELLRIKGAA